MRAALFVLAILLLGAIAPQRRLSAAPVYQGSWNSTCPLDSFMGPVDVSATPSGDVLVVQRVYRAERFSGTGGCISHWYVTLNSSQLYGIDALPGGGAVVLETQARKLRTFADDGTPLAVWGTFGIGTGQLEGPNAVRVSPSGEILVADFLRTRVLAFTAAGAFVREWAPTIGPGHMAVDDSGYVYLTNAGTGEAGMYRQDGTFVRAIGAPGFGPGRLAHPSGIAVSPDWLVYVSDDGNNMISIFTRSGTFLERFGGPGAGPEQFDGVGSMDFDSSGNLYVVDENNLRICKYGPGPSPSTRRSWGQLKVMHR